eukprot:1178967-Rhodomonas_salina.3
MAKLPATSHDDVAVVEYLAKQHKVGPGLADVRCGASSGCCRRLTELHRLCCSTRERRGYMTQNNARKSGGYGLEHHPFKRGASCAREAEQRA